MPGAALVIGQTAGGCVPAGQIAAAAKMLPTDEHRQTEEYLHTDIQDLAALFGRASAIRWEAVQAAGVHR